MAPYNVFDLTTISQAVLQAEYAVRGTVPLRAIEIEDELKTPDGAKKYPFNRIIYSNIGNPMVMGLKYSTFLRNLLALVTAPHVLSKPDTEICALLNCNQECVDRARAFVKENPSGVGAYTHSQGYLSVRKEVAAFIQQRDGFPSDPSNIYLSDGASVSVKTILQLLAGPNPGDGAFLLPIPQYPLYSAAIALNNAVAVKYYLLEDDGWSIDLKSLREAIETHRKTAKSTIRALILVNPGNPSGSVFSRETLRAAIDICDEYGISIMSDEVYQLNTYAEAPGKQRPVFHSMKKVLCEWEKDKGRKGPALFSFHSVSKGLLGECGLRGGYLECYNVPKEITAQIYKCFSVCLCSNTIGQVVVSYMVNPPKSDDEDKKHLKAVFESMERKAQILTEGLNKVPYMTCEVVSGAMYAFPRLYLPKRFVEEAETGKMAADTLYCLKLLEMTGVCGVPGNGFQQRENTFHMRITILEDEKFFHEFVEKISTFHKDLWKKYGSDSERAAYRKEIEERFAAMGKACHAEW